MNLAKHRTDTLNPRKNFVTGRQKQYWIEFQLLDEQGDPLPNMPFRAVNDATREGFVAEYAGASDDQGVIRLEGLYPLAITLLVSANPLAKVLQTRRLRALRAENRVSTPLEKPYRYDPPPAGFSPVEQKALAEGHRYHYLRIGQLCDALPELDPPLLDVKTPPAFHFPDPAFGGFTATDDELNHRHVLEICPFRAWSLVLHHQPEYSMANAYNLGLMANLSYSDAAKEMYKRRPDTDPSTVAGSVEEFFFRQCLDLSRTPMMIDAKKPPLPALVVDVPFDQRYTTAAMLDSVTVERTSDGPELPRLVIENTQLFYCINQSQVLVAWRGTHEQWDWLTDAQYRPMPADGTGCDLKLACTPLTETGNVHYGFLQAFEIAKKLFPKQLKAIQESSAKRKLFICGHSLGGALGLIHSAEIKSTNPLLYTFGMPRTFTAKALGHLKSVQHYRHVNDADTITSVPPEAELDNWLYDALGPLGHDLGYVWSVGELLAGKLVRFGDPYWHHGHVAMFYSAQQHLESRSSDYPSARNKDGLAAPYHNTIRSRLPHRAHLYLVPNLSDELSHYAHDEHKALIRSLDRESMSRFFPPHTNPERSTKRTSPIAHSMIKGYLPVLHSQLLELADPQRPSRRKTDRAKFEEQLHSLGTPEEEKQRNEHFVALHKLLPMALHATQEIAGGREALERFSRVPEYD